jgi:hypothetical protein
MARTATAHRNGFYFQFTGLVDLMAMLTAS